MRSMIVIRDATQVMFQPGAQSLQACLAPANDWQPLLCHHHFNKFLIVDLTVTINVCLPDHFIDFLIRELLTEIGHDVAQLSSTDETIAIAVEDLEGLNKLFFGISIFRYIRNM